MYVSVLFVADVKISYNTFKSCMVATADSKTIFTLDPGASIYNFLYVMFPCLSSHARALLSVCVLACMCVLCLCAHMCQCVRACMHAHVRACVCVIKTVDNY